MKVVINADYGGFGLSSKALLEYAKRKGITLYFYGNVIDDDYDAYRKLTSEDRDKIWFGTCTTKDLGETVSKDAFHTTSYDCSFSMYDIPRNDPDLIAVVESIGKDAGGEGSLRLASKSS